MQRHATHHDATASGALLLLHERPHFSLKNGDGNGECNVLQRFETPRHLIAKYC